MSTLDELRPDILAQARATAEYKAAYEAVYRDLAIQQEELSVANDRPDIPGLNPALRADNLRGLNTVPAPHIDPDGAKVYAGKLGKAEAREELARRADAGEPMPLASEDAILAEEP